MAREILNDKNLRKSIVVYFVLFLILVLGLVFYAKFSQRNSFAADSLTMNLQANIEKYINYKISDNDKGTLLQVGVKSGIEYNDENDPYVPVKQSQIKLQISKIDNKYPFKVSVFAKSTEATNGKIDNIKEEYRYDEQSGIIIINTSNLNESGELIKKEKTNINPLDEYIVMCYYDTYTGEAKERQVEINGEAIALLSEDDRLLNKQERFRGEVKDNIGELTSVEYDTDEISNGYIKSNIINGTNFDTEYTEEQDIVISKKENQDIVEISENNSFVKKEKNENGEEIKRDLGNNNELVYKNTVLYKNNILKLLGEDGKLEIFDSEQNKIVEINQNTQFNEDGTITINYERDLTSLIIKTSKIQNEGILKIKNTKLIKNTMHNAENISIKTTANINKENIIEIKDATTNIDVNISKTNWTNKEQNEVDFDITLKSISVKDNMFKNPKIKIQLPGEVEKVILSESYMVYGDQLHLENVTLEKDENGIQSIIISVDGTQDKYYSNNLDLLPSIKIPAIIILKKDFESANSNINISYINEFTVDGNYERKEYSKGISLENYKDENTVSNNNTLNARILTRTLGVAPQGESNNSSNIKTEVALYKGNKKIEENDVIYEGEFIKYNISVSNISGEDINNVKVIGSVPEGTVYGELRADYNNYMGEYRYIFDDSISNKEFNIGTIKAGEKYNISYEVKVKDIEENIQNIQLQTNVDTYISDNKVNNINFTNTVEKAEAKVFLGAFLDNSEDRWNYSLKVESTEDKQVEVKVQFPKEFKIEARVQAGGQDGTYEPVNIEADSDNIVTDTIETNKEYWYEGEIDSTLIEENVDNKPIVLNAYATANMDGKEYHSNENRINYELRSVSVTMTSNNEGEEVYPGENINYEIVVKNTGKTNLNQGDTDVFSVDVKDYLPDEVKPISVEYDYWEDVDGNWVKKNTTKDIKNIYTDEQGNKEPNVDLTINIPYNKDVKIKIKTTADKVIQKTKIENNAIVTGTYIKAKRSNTISHTILPTPTRNVTEVTEIYENNNGEENTNNNTENNTENNKNNQNSEKKFISGVAWLDENNDGERQETEQKMANVDVLLVDVNDTSKIAGKTTTNTDGSYIFNNLNSDKYIVVFKYDNQNYTVTQYKKSGISDNVNSDANTKEVKINGETIKAGVTDILTLNESQENIDIGLIKTGICDLKLDKYISKATVTTAKSTKQYSYNNQKLSKVEIKSKEIEGANVEVEYKIVVTNEGEVVASPSKIIDYLPDGFEFTKEVNENWAIQKNGQLINTSLSNKKLNPGESCELTLILTKKMSSNTTGQFKNTAEIGEISNSVELKDKDSTPGNSKEGEDDYSEATIIISIGTGGIIYIGIIITIIIALICTLIILNKKGKLKNKNILKISKLSIFVIIFAGIMFAGNNTSWSDSQVKRQLAYQQLQFYWKSENQQYRNAYGSTYFESLIKYNGNFIGAVCQDAGLAAFSGQYEFVKATGLVSNTYQNANEPEVSIQKTNDTTGVNINEVIDNGETYYIYGPIKFKRTIKNVKRENVKYTISKAYSGSTAISSNNIIILYRGLNGNQESSIGSITDDKIQPEKDGIKIYLKIKKSNLKSDSRRRGCFNGFSITASAAGQKVSTTQSQGYLHYRAPYGSYQSIKTINRYPAYEYKTSKTLYASMTETWDIMNFNVEIEKFEENTEEKLKNVSFCLSTQERYIVRNSTSSEKIYYKLPDSTKNEREFVKGYDYRVIGNGPDNNQEWTRDINEATKFTTGDDGKVTISNLNGLGKAYYIEEYQNSNYGYKISRGSSKTIRPNSTSVGYISTESSIYSCLISNTKITGNLEISKTDVTGGLLKGISFKIRKNDGSQNNYIRVMDQNKIIQSTVEGSFTIGGMDYTGKDEATEFITNDSGKIQLYNIIEGEYIVEEIKGPNYFGYDINDEDTVEWRTQTQGFKKNIKISSDKENIEVTIFDVEKNGYVIQNNNAYEYTDDITKATKFNVGNVREDEKYTIEVKGLPPDTYVVDQYDENDFANYEEIIDKNITPEYIKLSSLKAITNRFVLKDEFLNKYLKIDNKDEIIGEATIEENAENDNIEYVDNKNDATKFKANQYGINITNKLSNKFQVENENDEQNLKDYMILNGTDMYIYGTSNINYIIKNSNGYIVALDKNGSEIRNVSGKVELDKIRYTQNYTEATNFITDNNNQTSISNLPEDKGYTVWSKKGDAYTIMVYDLQIENRYYSYDINVKEQTSQVGKEGVRYCISKPDEDEESNKYLRFIDKNGGFINNVSELTTFERIEETVDIEKATNFITNEEGRISIQNLPLDEYTVQGIYDESETSANITYEINNTKEEGIVEQPGKGKDIPIDISKQSSGDKEFANKIDITNKKKYIKISGYAFEDIISGKESSRDNLYNEDNDKKLAGIVVKLYKSNGELLDKRITDEYGNYKFGDYINDKKIDDNGNTVPVDKIKIEDLEGAYIQFEYNGMSYETTNIVMKKDEQGNATNLIEDDSSKVAENITKGETGGISRNQFNDNYRIIEHNKSTNSNGETKNLIYNYENYSSTLKLGDNLIYGYDGQAYPVSGVYDQYKMTANTYDADSSRLLGQNLTMNDIYRSNIEEITNVNLGLRQREMPDLAISTDINKVEININGYKHTYSGNKRLSDENRNTYTQEEGGKNAIFNATVKAGSKYKEASYTRELYEADCNYTGKVDNPFEVYVTYEIKIRNESTNLVSTVNSLVNYYDKNYLEPDNNSNTESYNDNYNKLNLNNLNIQIKNQEEKSILIKFKLIKFKGITYDAELDTNVAMLNNYTEITSYSTTENNQAYAGIDKDSNPGNLTSNEETLVNEDDNDMAPSFKIAFDKARQLEGTVFLENLIDGKKGGPGNERQGNGIYDEGEKTIAGVKVGLYKTSDFDTAGKLIVDDNTGNIPEPSGKTYYTSNVSDEDKTITINNKKYYYNKNGVTAGDGKFIVTDFIPGNYKLVYFWGNGEYSVENYKGTIWTEDNRKEKYIDEEYKEENKEWYRNQTKDKNGKIKRFSDAKDNWKIREENKRIMQSSTNELRFRIDLNDDINSDVITSDVIENNIKFIVPNIDFGIVERAKQSLAVEKHVENMNVTLANGQTVIDAKLENGNLVGNPKGVNYLPGINSKSQILISLDSELIQGSKADITYRITLKNNSEKDYTTDDYYYYGITKDDSLIDLQPEGVYDYLDNTMVFNPDSNNLDDNGTWEILSLQDYSNNDVTDETIIEKYLHEKSIVQEETDEIITGYESFKDIYKDALKDWSMDTIKTARQKRLSNKTILHNSELESPIEVGKDNSVILKVSKVLSNQDEIDLNNDTEIVKIKDDNNNKTRINPVIELLYDKAENIVISTNPGRTDYTIETVQIILVCLIIVAVEIILVKKKIIR